MTIMMYTTDPVYIRREARIQLAMLRISSSRHSAMVYNKQMQLINFPPQLMSKIWSYIPANLAGYSLKDEWRLAHGRILDSAPAARTTLEDFDDYIKKIEGITINLYWDQHLPLILHVESGYSPHKTWIQYLNLPERNLAFSYRFVSTGNVALGNSNILLERLLHALVHVMGHYIPYFQSRGLPSLGALATNWSMRQGLITRWMYEADLYIRTLREFQSFARPRCCCMTCALCHDHYVPEFWLNRRLEFQLTGTVTFKTIWANCKSPSVVET